MKDLLNLPCKYHQHMAYNLILVVLIFSKRLCFYFIFWMLYWRGC